jgi:hypothetical protein
VLYFIKWKEGETVSALIARVEKYTAISVRGIEIHSTREKESQSNPDIDSEKSKLNYDLHQHPTPEKNFYMRCKDRISELNLKRAVRKDAVVMAQILITSEKIFFENKTPEETKLFFTDSYKFICDYYGKQNIISAIVHMDEKTPHLEVNMVPITADGRLCAKDLFTPDNRVGTGKYHVSGKHKGKEIKERVHGTGTLSKFQDKIFERIGKPRNMERGEVGSTRKHLKTPEYKAAMKELEDVREEIREDKIERDKIASEVSNLQNTEGKLKKDILALEAKKSEIDANIVLEMETHAGHMQSCRDSLVRENEILDGVKENIKTAENKLSETVENIKIVIEEAKESLEKEKNRMKDEIVNVIAEEHKPRYRNVARKAVEAEMKKVEKENKITVGGTLNNRRIDEKVVTPADKKEINPSRKTVERG